MPGLERLGTKELPGAGMQKSTWQVVPPKAAAV